MMRGILEPRPGDFLGPLLAEGIEVIWILAVLYDRAYVTREGVC